MKKLIILLIPFQFVCASENFKTQIGQLYPNWEIGELAVGDLNKDGKDDAVVLHNLSEKKGDSQSAMNEVSLRFFFNDGNGNLKLFLDAPKAICATCGGLAGPGTDFTLEYKKGTIHVTMSGGARNRFSQTFIWRFQESNFSLIGVNEYAVDTYASEKGSIESTETSANLSTLKMEVITHTLIKNRSEDDDPITQKSVKKCPVPASFRGIKIRKFDISSFEIPRCR